MNIVETLQKMLSDSNILDAYNGTHVDYIESSDSDAGMYCTGPQKTGEDIIGNPTYRLNCQLYTGMRGNTDYDMQVNNETQIKLTYYLDDVGKGTQFTEEYNGTECPAEVTDMSVSNAMFYSIPTGDPHDGVRYQIQIAVDYKLNLYD